MFWVGVGGSYSVGDDPLCAEALVEERDGPSLVEAGPQEEGRALDDWLPWLRTNGVNTNGAAAKVMTFDRLGKRYALARLGI